MDGWKYWHLQFKLSTVVKKKQHSKDWNQSTQNEERWKTLIKIPWIWGGFPPIFGSTPKWRPTDCDVPDGCEELDGNPSSGHVLTGEILAEHDGDEVGVVEW